MLFRLLRRSFRKRKMIDISTFISLSQISPHTTIYYLTDIIIGMLEEVEPMSQEDQAESLTLPSILPQERQQHAYGNNILLLKIPQCTLLIGPDYHYFMAAFAFLLTLGLLSTLYLSHTKAPSWTIAATLFLTIFHSVTYLALALSDPSIAQATEPIAEGSDRTRFCRRCNFNVVRRSHHCERCGVCIQNHDHHCVWTSKCIGGGNQCLFYLFYFMTPVYLIFCLVLCGISIPTTTSESINSGVKLRGFTGTF